MPNPAKPASLSTGKIGKENIQARQQAEQQLKGQANNIKPPSYLNPNQKKIFKHIVSEMELTGVLNNLDIYNLAQTVITIDSLQQLTKQLNADPELLKDRAFMSTFKDLDNQLMKHLNDLAMTPTSRARLAGLIAQNQIQEEDPVLKALRGEDIE